MRLSEKLEPTQTYTVRSWRLDITLLVAVVWVALFVAFVRLKPYFLGEAGYLIFSIAWLISGYLAVRKLAVRELAVTLSAEWLIVRQEDSLTEQQIPLDQIASYFYQDNGSIKLFRLRLHSGEKVVLRHNRRFCPADDLSALVRVFEAQIGQGSTDASSGSRPSIQREPTFFEKPVSTVGLLLIPGVMIGLWVSGYSALLTPGLVCSAVFGYVIYLGAWLNRTEARNERSE